MQKILIDTDPGQDIDDLLAIHFALLRPELEVCAITTVTHPAIRRARMVKRLLRYLDRSNVPVAAGMEFPLRPLSQREQEFQQDFSQSMNHEAFALPADPSDAPDPISAPELIIRTVEQYPGEVILTCIAPLTNIAAALCQRPDIAPKVRAIYLMGGEITLNRVEHNIAFDFIAADVVLSSGIPITMGTWDVTRRFTIPMEEMGRFRRHSAPLCQALARAAELWHPAQSWKPGPVMYDVFPIVHAFDTSYYKTMPMRVQVETAGHLTRGMTVVSSGAPNVNVTTDVRVADLREMYFSTVLAGK